MRLVPAAALAVALTAASTHIVSAQPEPLTGEAKKNFDKALADFNRKDYPAAAAGFEAVYRDVPRFDVLFAWAQASRLSGDCAKALKLYRELERDPALKERDRVAVEKGIRKCGAEPGERPPDEETDDEPDEDPDGGDSDRATTTPATTAAPLAAVSAERPWYADGLGDALLAAGVVTAGFGAGLFVVSASDADAADRAATEADHIRFESRARSRRIMAVVSVSIGGALIGGAVFRYLTRERGESAPSIAVSAGPDAVGFAVRGAF